MLQSEAVRRILARLELSRPQWDAIHTVMLTDGRIVCDDLNLSKDEEQHLLDQHWLSRHALCFYIEPFERAMFEALDEMISRMEEG